MGRVALLVKIDEQGAETLDGQPGGKIAGSGRFSDAPFLIGDSDDAHRKYYLLVKK
jgi:hypothetical protein